MTWQQRGAAVVSPVTLTNGKGATIAVVGPRSNPKGAAILLQGASKGEVTALPLAEGVELLSPAHLIEILGLQERLHGDSGLRPPTNLKTNT